ncbi:hypothetical protein M33023_03520 [Candidatus Phytoplasma asteris]|uniref:Uncharacterized protein n=1 Tax=Candidatus Phytoplasma asteris TaxID=85620 RepID=A0ABZ2YFI3_9MOLU
MGIYSFLNFIISNSFLSSKTYLVASWAFCSSLVYYLSLLIS